MVQKGLFPCLRRSLNTQGRSRNASAVRSPLLAVALCISSSYATSTTGYFSTNYSELETDGRGGAWSGGINLFGDPGAKAEAAASQAAWIRSLFATFVKASEGPGKSSLRIRNGSRTGTDKRSRRSRPALVRRSILEVGRKCRRKSWCRRCCRNCSGSRCCTFPI